MLSPVRRATRPFILGLAVFLFGAVPSAQDILIPTGASWRYSAGARPAGSWTAIAYSDTAWDTGQAQLGYGDADEATVIPFGPGPNPDPNDKYISYYFRRSFPVPNRSSIGNLRLRILRDDGAVVYLNGTEVRRTNMASGPVHETTISKSKVDTFEEQHFFSFDVDSALLVEGRNVLAVEVHQWDVSSPDVSFDLELAANVTPTVIRGPYLQCGAEDSMVLRWRTDVATDSRVSIGDAPGSPDRTIDEPGKTQEHEVEITGLVPEKKYFYSIGTIGGRPLAGGDSQHWFETSPPIGVARPMRIWVLGDSGTASLNALLVRDAYLNLPGSEQTDFVMLLGDNAYNLGTDGEYEFALFAMYAPFLPTRVFWPARGNHEFYADDYYSVFTAPTAAEAGGNPSGSEAYYSFDYANAHFISLDSFGSDRSVGGDMWTWLQADLSSTEQDWVIAFWHHPPYTKGNHDSDSETELVEMRENFLPLLEAGGVDLVLTGHSHSYERSHMIAGHYLDSSTWSPAMVLDAGVADPELGDVYVKEAGFTEGTVYCVTGSAGKVKSAPLDHPAMHVSLADLGSLVLEIDDDVLSAFFVDATGAIDDRFEIYHLPLLSDVEGGRGVRDPSAPEQVPTDL